MNLRNFVSVGLGPALLGIGFMVAALPARAETSPKKSFTTAAGLTFRHPADWEVAQNQGLTVLVPAGADRDETGSPMHLLFVAAAPVPASQVSGPDDPQVGQSMDQEVAASVPGLVRVGAVETFQLKSGAKGAIYTYEGSAGGPVLRLRVFVRLSKSTNTGMVTMYLARKDVAHRFEAAALTLSKSMKMGGGSGGSSGSTASGGGGDPALVRTWSWIEVGGSSSSSGGLYANDESRFTFAADGSVQFTTSSTLSGGGADWSIDPSTSSSTKSGRYTASGGQLNIHWSDGTTQSFTYSFLEVFDAPALKLQPSSGKPMYFQ